MKRYSIQIGGVFAAAAGILLVQFGLSDSCSNEIIAKIMPLIGGAPGLLAVYFARLSKGDVGALGGKRR